MAGPQQATEHLGETRGSENHDHDLIPELGRRLDALWRFDQYIANAAGKPELQACWQPLKDQEQRNIQALKGLIAEEIRQGCF